ncbi:unnamed protein product, partial [Mesorhabditis spiculigera]
MLAKFVFLGLVSCVFGCVPGHGRSPPIIVTVNSKIPKAWVTTTYSQNVIITAIKESLRKAFSIAETEYPKLKGYTMENLRHVKLIPETAYFCPPPATTPALARRVARSAQEVPPTESPVPPAPSDKPTVTPTAPTPASVGCTYDEAFVTGNNPVAGGTAVHTWKFGFVLDKVTVPTSQEQLTEFAQALQDGLKSAEYLDDVTVNPGTMSGWREENF